MHTPETSQPTKASGNSQAVKVVPRHFGQWKFSLTCFQCLFFSTMPDSFLRYVAVQLANVPIFIPYDKLADGNARRCSDAVAERLLLGSVQDAVRARRIDWLYKPASRGGPSSQTMQPASINDHEMLGVPLRPCTKTMLIRQVGSSSIP
jgi:hypothetical protein